MELHRSSVELMVIGTSDAQYRLCCWQQPARSEMHFGHHQWSHRRNHIPPACYITSVAEYFFNSAMWSTFFDRSNSTHPAECETAGAVWENVRLNQHVRAFRSKLLGKLCKKATAAWQEVFSLYDVVSIWHPRREKQCAKHMHKKLRWRGKGSA